MLGFQETTLWLTKKLGINSKTNYPILSILDPKIIINSPKNVIRKQSCTKGTLWPTFWAPGGSKVVPRLQNGVQKGSQNPPKIIKNRPLSPNRTPWRCSGPPGHQKTPQIIKFGCPNLVQMTNCQSFVCRLFVHFCWLH